MIELGSLALNGAPRVAVGFGDNEVQKSVAAAVEAGVDVAEIRIDQFSSYESGHVKNVLKAFSRLPTIATIRIHEEGGHWDGDEAQRQRLFKAILPLVDAIDIELRATDTLAKIAPLAKAAGKLLVISYHDFDTTPDLETLRDIVGQAKMQGADVVKIATHVAEPRHVKSLAEVLIEQAAMNLIVIGMGPKGLVTRLLFPALGSLLTFAAAGAHQTAPGQLPYTDTFDLLRSLYPQYNEEKIISLELMEGI